MVKLGWDTPITTHVTLPNLHWFGFKGSSAYLEALIPWMIAPSLENFQITFFDQLTFSVPHLLEFMATTENLRFLNAEFWFSPKRLRMQAYSHEGAKKFLLSVGVRCGDLDRQVVSAVQTIDSLRTVFSAVEYIYSPV